MIKVIVPFIVYVAIIHYTKAAPPSPIPIPKQGKNFPVPYIKSHDPEDFFDDKFYADINDEVIKKVMKDNGGASKAGDNRKPGKPTVEFPRKPTSPTRQPKPSANQRTPSTSGRRTPQPSNQDRPRNTGGSSDRKKPVPVENQGPSDFPVPVDKQHYGDDFFDDRFYPDINDEVIKKVMKDNRVPTNLPDASGSSRNDKRKPSKPKPTKSRSRPSKPDSTKPSSSSETSIDISKYVNAPSYYFFKAAGIKSSDKVYKTTMFATDKERTLLTRGGPNDEFEVQIVHGPTTGLQVFYQITSTERILGMLNPEKNTIVGRIKTYKLQ